MEIQQLATVASSVVNAFIIYIALFYCMDKSGRIEISLTQNLSKLYPKSY